MIKGTIFILLPIFNIISNYEARDIKPFEYLINMQDRYHKIYYIYEDNLSAGNHFFARGKISSWGEEDYVMDMEEDYTEGAYSGIDCIKAIFKARGLNWGGWYFLNGILRTGEINPEANWGDYPEAGEDLTGAKKLIFYARGEKGGERVNFFCFGVGWDNETMQKIKPYPDSSPQLSTGFITLKKDWQRYEINLDGADLRYVIGGFGWVTSAVENNGNDITFYIDEVYYDKERLEEARFILSYETILSDYDFDRVNKNVAYLYDNSLALIAFLKGGYKERARYIADAIIYAMENDRYYEDGRLRNGYQSGDLKLPKGWYANGKLETVRMPGWYDKDSDSWKEDEFQVSSYTGNIAWAMISLLSFYEFSKEEKYLKAVEKLGEWVENNCKSHTGFKGYIVGFRGWEPEPQKLEEKSTEHNLDLYLAFIWLYEITNEEKWKERADYAKEFIYSMWDQKEGKFFTGTQYDNGKEEIRKDVIPLDIQVWANLIFNEEKFRNAFDYIEKNLKVGKGYDFNNDKDGIWYEGTAQVALGYRYFDKLKSREILEFLRDSLCENGGLYASNIDGLSTGFECEYYKRKHIGATSWYIFAEEKINPFDWEKTSHQRPFAIFKNKDNLLNYCNIFKNNLSNI